MKKLLIIDGNEKDIKKIGDAAGSDYDVSALSYYDVMNMALSTVITIVNTLDSSDEFSAGHSLRVAVVAGDIAKNLGWDERACRNLYFVCLLHDIGMLTVPESIRNKPDRLTDEEYGIVKTHCEKGSKMLSDIGLLEGLSQGALCHHERWDGRGYPQGLSGAEIPEIARIIAVADAYDAMSSDRVYRRRLSSDKIISEFLRCKGTQFDPDITDVFVFMLKEGYSVEPGIEQSKAASERAVKAGGLGSLFSAPAQEFYEDSRETDTITGLFTRSYLNTRVGKKISEERTGALMLIDITGFKELCESAGGDEVNRVLKDFADRLRSYFREEDIVCHISFNNFAVYVSGQSGKNVVEKKASMITQITDTFEEFAAYRDMLGVSIGIAMCQEDGVTFEELFRVALDALHEIEKSGENAYIFAD